MKRVLIITYYWPPSAGSGVQRWLKMSKYLPDFGWQPVIYTPENPDFNLKDDSLLADVSEHAEILKTKIWEPYRIHRFITGTKPGDSNFGMTKEGENKSLTKRISFWFRGNVFVPDPRITWRNSSISFLKKYIKENPVDAIITTGPPHSMHLIGLGVKKHFPNLKWVADFRDPWSTFDVHNSFLSESGKKKNEAMEREVLENADHLVMTSDTTKGEFPKFDETKLSVITNGFDEADFLQLQSQTSTANSNSNSNSAADFGVTRNSKLETRNPPFRIYHTGLLNMIRNPIPFFEALAELCEESAEFAERLQLELIGNVDQQIIDYLKNHKSLSGNANTTKWMKHDDLLLEYQKASVLLIIVNQSRNAISQLPGKLFECLAMRKPILALCPTDSALATVIKETDAGLAVDFNDKKGLKIAIKKQFEDYKNGHSLVGSADKIDRFSRKRLAERLVKEILEV